MDIWLTPEEVMKELGLIQSQPPKNYDNNLESLRQERKLKYDLNKCVKTQTPILLKHENNYSFQYRRWDGAHWHTELRQVDTERISQGLTEKQKRLKENIDLIFSLKHFEFTPRWITPLEKGTNNFDPRYQLIRIGDIWCCVINNSVYESTNYRKQQYKNYIEISFSTKNEPLFTLESTEALLDKLIK